MELLVFIYLATIWLLAGFLTGVTSFGGNLFAIPLMTLVMDAKEAIIAGCLGGIMIFTALIIIYRHAILWRETVYLGISGLSGVHAGVWILEHASSRFLLLAAGASIALFLLWQLFANRLHIARKPASTACCLPLGFLSGLMMSSIGMGGPPMVIYAYLRKWGKENTIAGTNLAVSFEMAGIVPVQWHAGLYTPDILWLSFWLAVFAIAGVLVSIPVERRINDGIFRRLLIATLAFSAIMLLVRGTLS